MQEETTTTKDTSLFTELTAEESASVNGAYYCRPRRRYYNSPYYDGRRTHGYVPYRRYRYYG